MLLFLTEVQELLVCFHQRLLKSIGPSQQACTCTSMCLRKWHPGIHIQCSILKAFYSFQVVHQEGKEFEMEVRESALFRHSFDESLVEL